MVIDAVEGSFGAYGGGESAMCEEEEFCDDPVDWWRALELCWRRAFTRLVIGAIWERRSDSSEVSMYLYICQWSNCSDTLPTRGGSMSGKTDSAFECAILGSTSTSNSNSAILSS